MCSPLFNVSLFRLKDRFSKLENSLIIFQGGFAYLNFLNLTRFNPVAMMLNSFDVKQKMQLFVLVSVFVLRQRS